MIGVEDILKIMRLVLATGHLVGEKPVSLLILSDRPESGKTEIVCKYMKTNGTDYANNVSAFGIRRDLFNSIASGKLRHLVIPELLSPLSSKTVASSLVGALQTLMEDGTMSSHVGFTKKLEAKERRVLGVIACMPRSAFGAHQADWQHSGFISRWLVVSYKYDTQTVDEIFASIGRGDYMLEKDTPLNFDYDIDIKISNGLMNQCVEYASDMSKEERERGSKYGFRMSKNLIRLAKANVLLDRVENQSNRDEVTEKDVQAIQDLAYLFNSRFNEVKHNKTQVQSLTQKTDIKEIIDRYNELQKKEYEFFKSEGVEKIILDYREQQNKLQGRLHLDLKVGESDDK